MTANSSAFDVGCKVIKKDFQRKKRANGKLDARFLWPYMITKKLGKGLYSLKLISNPSCIISSVNVEIVSYTTNFSHAKFNK